MQEIARTLINFNKRVSTRVGHNKNKRVAPNEACT